MYRTGRDAQESPPPLPPATAAASPRLLSFAPACAALPRWNGHLPSRRRQQDGSSGSRWKEACG